MIVLLRSFLLISLALLLGCDKPQPKILIIGDSISLGYTPFVKEMLGEKAIVQHNTGNAQHTGTGLEKIEEWIGDNDWDIIQFNWGMWDLCYRHDDSKVQGKRDKVNGSVTYKPYEYQVNLDIIVRRIKELSDAKLLFVSTTYVPEGEAGRFVRDGTIYNQAAMEVMKKHEIKVNDIYDYSKSIHPDYSTAKDNVHFTPEGYKLLAIKVIEGLTEINKKLETSSE